MHNLQCRQACSALRGLVRVYAQREVGPLDSDLVEPIPARLEQTLEFQFGDFFEVFHRDGHHQSTHGVSIIGAYPLSGCTIALKKGVSSFGIFFQPVGLSRLFGIPMTELSMRAYDGRAVLGKSISSLHIRLAEVSCFEGRVRLAEDFLLKQAAQAQREDPMAKAASEIFAARGALRIADVAYRHGLGVRHFERRFLQHVGFTPKLFARVARFQTALDVKIMSPKSRWADIANDLGYHDQMHMVHDFHDLAGDAPELLMSRLGDARPPALAQEDS
jgi:AraC-like DNA-binding protein